ncbi:MAG: hypothetical protein IJ523_07110 [Succinivibrionaceae bacterium]|nr:hypothetical protein [Succinivibrionaceae bacterium]MBQ9611335.1 hypothetical protein [Lachnospiraceae bacterium]
MAVWMWLVIGILVGFSGGYGLSVVLHSKTFAGTLREDHSDSTEAPYLFLELEHGGLEKIHKYRTVTFKVKIEDYLPRR